MVPYPEGRTVPAAGVIVPRGPLLPHEPTVIGLCVLLSRLGVGGMGAVYHVRDRRGRPVAVKVIRPDRAGDQEYRRRFRREVEAARRPRLHNRRSSGVVQRALVPGCRRSRGWAGLTSASLSAVGVRPGG
ncbi:hypothetical protein FMEAI12_2490013 [Parafrankia sp. Ea1.12]|nr:hypothetical protein FMEAI12_2490013 [Parafrankia sp. Ea1.12]